MVGDPSQIISGGDGPKSVLPLALIVGLSYILMRMLKNCFILLLNKTVILPFLGGTLTKIAYYSTVSQRVINYETEESGAGNQVS